MRLYEHADEWIYNDKARGYLLLKDTNILGNKHNALSMSWKKYI